MLHHFELHHDPSGQGAHPRRSSNTTGEKQRSCAQRAHGWSCSMGWFKGKSKPETIDFHMKIMGCSCNFSQQNQSIDSMSKRSLNNMCNENRDRNMFLSQHQTHSWIEEHSLNVYTLRQFLQHCKWGCLKIITPENWLVHIKHRQIAGSNRYPTGLNYSQMNTLAHCSVLNSPSLIPPFWINYNASSTWRKAILGVAGYSTP